MNNIQIKGIAIINENNVISLFADCYDKCNPDSLPSNCTVSNQTLQYQDNLNAVNECIIASGRNFNDPCTSCAKDYDKLISVFDSIKASTTSPCYDLEDMVSQTTGAEVFYF